jgi:hypothetical protein
MLSRILAFGFLIVGTAVAPQGVAVQSQTASAAQAQGALVGWVVVSSDEFTIEPSSSAELIAECPAAKVPIGGGFSKAPSVPDSAGGVEIAASFPAFFTFESQTISGWIVHVVNRSVENAFVKVWAVCARS